MNEVRFERLGCFAYSAEEGTPAAKLDGQVPEEVKQARQENIMDTQERIMEELCAAQEGKEITVMVEGFDRYAGSFFGRSEADAPEVDGKIFFTAGKQRSLNAGEMVRVKISDCLGCDLIGELVCREN